MRSLAVFCAGFVVACEADGEPVIARALFVVALILVLLFTFLFVFSLFVVCFCCCFVALLFVVCCSWQ